MRKEFIFTPAAIIKDYVNNKYTLMEMDKFNRFKDTDELKDCYIQFLLNYNISPLSKLYAIRYTNDIIWVDMTEDEIKDFFEYDKYDKFDEIASKEHKEMVDEFLTFKR